MKTLLFPLAVCLVMQTTPSYQSDMDAFRTHRAAEISGPTGWAALVGLHSIARPGFRPLRIRWDKEANDD